MPRTTFAKSWESRHGSGRRAGPTWLVLRSPGCPGGWRSLPENAVPPAPRGREAQARTARCRPDPKSAGWKRILARSTGPAEAVPPLAQDSRGPRGSLSSRNGESSSDPARSREARPATQRLHCGGARQRAWRPPRGSAPSIESVKNLISLGVSLEPKGSQQLLEIHRRIRRGSVAQGEGQHEGP